MDRPFQRVEHEPSVHRAAAIYSLIVTAKLNVVDQQAWLADVLGRIQNYPMAKLDELLSWNPKAARLTPGQLAGCSLLAGRMPDETYHGAPTPLGPGLPRTQWPTAALPKRRHDNKRL